MGTHWKRQATNEYPQMENSCSCVEIIKETCTVLPATSDSDVMFCLQVIRGLESIDPILWIGLIHK